MNYNTNRFGNSLDTTKFSTHAKRDVVAVSFAFFCSGFGQADRVVRFGGLRVITSDYSPGRTGEEKWKVGRRK